MSRKEHLEQADCLIVGAGPAGLTAATYLARFHRRVALVDCDESRARYIPVSHNCPGFPFGVSGRDLLARMRKQAAQFGVEPVAARVDTLERREDGFFARAGDRAWQATKVLLATGIRDRLPVIDGLEQGIADGVVRICAICDGYEAGGDRIAVFGPPASVLGHAIFLRTFSSEVCVVLSEDGEPPAPDRARATGLGIDILPTPQALRLVLDATQKMRSCRVSWPGSEREFDTLYPVLGADPKGHLASSIGALRDENGELIVDARMQTSVEGCYAAGDAVSSINQIAVAVGQASIAAIAIHNALPDNPRAARARAADTGLPAPA